MISFFAGMRNFLYFEDVLQYIIFVLLLPIVLEGGVSGSENLKNSRSNKDLC